MDMSNICLTCLKAEPDMISVFISMSELQHSQLDISNNTDRNHEESTNLDLTINEMIVACTPSMPTDIEDLPKQLCKICVQDLHAAYVFRKRSENTFRKLKLFLLGDDEHDEIKSDCNAAISPNKDGFFFKPNEKFTQTAESCIFMCEFCKIKFFNAPDLKAHRLLHKNSDIKCQICGKQYSRLTNLQRHVSSAHPKEFNVKQKMLTSHTCNICNKNFSRSDHLTRHKKTVHKNAKSIKREVVRISPVLEKNDDDIKDMVKRDSDSDSNDMGEAFNDASDTNEISLNAESDYENRDDTVNIKTEAFEEIAIDDMHNKINVKTSNKTDNFVDVNVVPSGQIKPEKVSDAEIDSDHEDAFKPEITVSENFDDIHTSALAEQNTETKPKIYKCRICYATFTTSAEYIQHRFEHETAEEFTRPNQTKIEHQCFECKKFFSRGCHLRRHMITHTKERPYSCEYCGNGFRRHEHLRNHIACCHQNRKKEDNPQNYVCEFCSKSFILGKYLKRHLLIHTRDSYDCRSCKEKFKTGKELSEHSRCHTSERPHLCSECGLRFARPNYLIIHMRKHTGERPFKCKYCGKGFTRQSLASVHERYHTGERNHLCTVCGKGFFETSNLAVHMRTHTGEKPYQCPHCDKSFAQSNDLKAHVRRHTGERYTCDICGDSFIHNYHLTRHKRARHGLNVSPSNRSRFSQNYTNTANSATMETADRVETTILLQTAEKPLE